MYRPRAHRKDVLSIDSSETKDPGLSWTVAPEQRGRGVRHEVSACVHVKLGWVQSELAAVRGEE